MTENRFQQLLAELVEDVDGQLSAPGAWHEAGRRRRRRRLILISAATAAAVVAGIGAVGRGPDRVTSSTPDRTPSSAPPSDGWPGARLSTAPDTRSLPSSPASAGVVRALSDIPASAPPLAGGGVSRVVALVAPPGGPLLVLAADGTWRRSGTSPPPGAAAIASDGTRFAVPDGDGILVTEARTGRSTRFAAGAQVEEVLWYPDGDRLLGSGDAVRRVWTLDGRSSDPGFAVHTVAAGRPGDPVVEVTPDSLTFHEGDGAVTRRPLDTGGTVGLDDAFGTGWIRAGRVVQAFFLDDTEAQVLAVADLGTGRVSDVLRLGDGTAAGRAKGCCAVLGWADDRTVLLRDGDAVLAWRPGRAELTRVATVPGRTQVTLAP